MTTGELSWEPLRIPNGHRRYQACIGTGGIGSGIFFALNGSHTLGREESRSGRLLDRRDYCKLHIITHYIQTLAGDDFLVLPIGLVGDDESGHRLLEEMRQAGLDLGHVDVLPGCSTLFSICFVYPDGSGGNLTTDDSASARVSVEAIQAAEPELVAYANRGIALAVPEVPLAARQELLKLAKAFGHLCAASFATEEIPQAIDNGMLDCVDVLAVNRDEAARLAGVSSQLPAREIAKAAAAFLSCKYPEIKVSITAGDQGSWVWDGHVLDFHAALDVNAVGTAGAGDAHLAGLLTGLIAGLNFQQAHQLAVLVGALSVTSPHTIHKQIDRRTLADLASRFPSRFSDSVRMLLTTA